MSRPPSTNRIMGVLWLGELLYPQVYDYDIVEEMQEFYELFYRHDLSEEEALEMLEKASVKADANAQEAAISQ